MTTTMGATTEELDSEEERAFRLQAREYLGQADLPPRVPNEPVYKWDDDAFVARDRAIQRTLWDGGFAGITVPVEYGGRGLSDRFDAILVEEARPYRMPWAFGVNRNVIIPPMLAHASEGVKRRHIPPMLRGDHIWCQLLSEPSGGSDLAGLLSRAARDGDVWLLNGSKIWTTGGNHADFGACLARTAPEVPKHAGLTMFVVDMKQPGMTVVPLHLADGSAHFCQEYLDDVVVPADDTIGEVDDGWRAATTMLMHERAAIGRGWDYGKERAARAEHLSLSTNLVEFVREAGLASDPHVRQLLGEIWVLDALLDVTPPRVAAGMASGALPGYAAAIVKLMSGKAGTRRTALLSELAGPLGVAAPVDADVPFAVHEAGITRVTLHNIGGGTGEMQANMIAERLLGLPREPSPDRELPFNQLLQNAVPSPPQP
jgi:alkylation response protein AidB-like acyl-CoA dehydrogenase